jgi:serine/threonine-protein kinase
VAEAHVTQLVLRVLDSDCTPEEACKESPELLAEVLEQLQHIRSIDMQVDALFPESPSESMDGAEDLASDARTLPQVPGHEVLSVLGHGGMGAVYKARHIRLNRAVAVKMLLAGTHSDPASLKRFLREAEAVAALRHPNIVQVHEVGEHDGLPYFTMELIEGGSLNQKLKARAFDAREAASLVSILAEAVDVAHSSGIVHRDLKPANVLLTPDGVPKIVDFGLARRIEAESSLTRTDALLGTPSYMAPEQAQGGSRAVGPAADVYALGAILFATLTGRPPFIGDAWPLTLRHVLEDEPTPPSRLNSRVPRDLETICLKCLSKDPTRRYVTAGDLASDLRRFVHGEPIHARPIGIVERAAKWVRRRPAHATIAAGAVLAAVSLAGALLWLSLQRAAIAHAAEEDLREVDRAVATVSWASARTAVERARARLATAGSSDLAGSVEQAARDLDLVDLMDTIRMQQAALTDGKLDRERNKSAADSAYRAAFRELGFGELPEHRREAAARIRSSRIRPVLVSALDSWATCVIDDLTLRDALLDVVRLVDPDPTGWRDCVRDPSTWNDKRALAELVDSAPASAESIQLLLALAEHVISVGADAKPFLTRIQQEYPADFWACTTLGRVLLPEHSASAVGYFQAALAMRPDSATARTNLGAALGAAGRIDESIVQAREAILLDPSMAYAYATLGRGLSAKGDFADAAGNFMIALGIDPSAFSTETRCNLGRCLLETGRLDESVVELRAAVRLDPRSNAAHYALGYALHTSGLVDEASEQFRQSIALEPRHFAAHESLGYVLQATGRVDEAIECFRETVRLKPSHAAARETLIHALIARGRFADARMEAASLLQAIPEGDRQRRRAEIIAKHSELVAALAADLPAIQDGTRVPQSGAESLAFADLFCARRDYARATRYFAEAFAAHFGTPYQVIDGDWRTFDAARCAALAGAITNDVDGASSDERKGWRALALAWLREQLEADETLLRQGRLSSKHALLLSLVEWRVNPDLAGLRDDALVERLPEDEREPWRALWRDVDSLSARARSRN